MIEIIESQGLKVTNWELDLRKKGFKISMGYLKASAKKGTSIGFWLIENFLTQFKDVDVTWLITGQRTSWNNDRNGTPEGKTTGVQKTLKKLQERIDELSKDKKGLQEDKAELRRQLDELRKKKAGVTG